MMSALGLVDACEVCGEEGVTCCPKCGEVLCWDHLGMPCWHHQSVAVDLSNIYDQSGAMNEVQLYIAKSQIKANNLDIAKMHLDAIFRSDFYKRFQHKANLIDLVAGFWRSFFLTSVVLDGEWGVLDLTLAVSTSTTLLPPSETILQNSKW